MKTKRNILGGILLAFAGGIIAVVIFSLIYKGETKYIVQESPASGQLTSLPSGANAQPVDLTYAAEKTIHAVVHVKTKSMQNESYSNPLYEFFFGERYYQQEPRMQMGFGSGVILSSDGYVVTNDHVVEGSDEIEVVLNDKRTYVAEIVGRDPSTDLALLKIKGKDLPFIPYGNSEDLKIGEWVLAVGNPFNLTSTVTAGIVSAKARNINILSSRDRNPIEAYIQTDAAVNRGNSGGALVNTRGELIGINAAIIAPTGTYSGYSFAIPVTLVKKVVDDLKEFGVVQRALLGVTIRDVTSELSDEEGMDKIEGVYVDGLAEGGAAKDAGIQTGDIIISVNDVKVNSVSELQEQISKFRPGEKVRVVIKRNNKAKQFDVVLRNMDGSTKLIKPEDIFAMQGARFRELSTSDKKKLGVESGVEVTELTDGKLKTAGIKKGFIITAINGRSVDSPMDVQNSFNQNHDAFEVEGTYPGSRYKYVYVVR